MGSHDWWRNELLVEESAVDTYMSYSLTMNIHRSTATVTVEYDDSSQWKTLIN